MKRKREKQNYRSVHRSVHWTHLLTPWEKFALAIVGIIFGGILLAFASLIILAALWVGLRFL